MTSGNTNQWNIQAGNKDVRSFLNKIEKKQLIDLIFELAQNNSEFMEQLKLLLASSPQSKGKSAETFKKALDKAFFVNDYISYNEVYDYCHGIDLVVESLKKALENGHLNVVLEATGHGLSLAAEVMNSADSECELYDIFQELLSLHIEAYKKSNSDPGKMAGRLFSWEISDGYGNFDISGSYINQLDEVCRQQFFELAKSEWDNLPALNPGEEQSHSESRYNLTRIMENTARASNSLQSLIAVKSKDLSCAYNYLRIAEDCRKAGEFGLALQWAEDGVKAFPQNCDSRLLDFLADEYHRLNRHDDAMTLAWYIFVKSSQLSGYKELSEHATKAKCWDIWRSEAIACIRQKIEADVKRNQRWGIRPDNSTLVEILLWEKRYEEAWGEANIGRCSDRLWMSLADGRAESHPADSAEIYRKLIPDIIGQANNNAYAEAVGLLKRIRECMRRSNQEDEFKNYCVSLRQGHKAKRNFIAEMNRKGL